jgi:hypothetical protein
MRCIFRLHAGALYGANPLAWDQEASVASGHDLNRIPFGHIAHCSSVAPLPDRDGARGHRRDALY